jgi:putative spermidine/putrescine transport system substrate-binding protein
MKKYTSLLLMLTVFSLNACISNSTIKEKDPSQLSWDEILKQATGQTVNFMMWQGDPQINKYINSFVIPAVKEKYGIILETSAGQGNQLVSILMGEIDAAKTNSEIDMCWINGETFYQLKQIDALFGPFVSQIPNAAFINFDNPFIKYDFQTLVNGMECPWGNVQLCLIYNKDKVPVPPKNRLELESFVKQNPGKFTIPNDFAGLTFLKSLLIDIAGGGASLSGAFDEGKYKNYSGQLWQYINRIKPYMWKSGKTFPNSVAPMHQMFSQGELYVTLSNNDGEVDNKVTEGTLPTFARSYVLDAGTIQNSHYLGITKNSNQKAAAMVVINFLVSPEAQIEKQKSSVWGDGTVLDLNKLTAIEKSAFDSLQTRVYGSNRATIQPKALMELAPEYMIRLNDDFRKYVIQQ